MIPASSEARGLTRGKKAVKHVAIRSQHAGIQIGMQPAKALTGKDV